MQEQPDGAARQPSTEELEHSSERLQRERALNGTVPTAGTQGGLHNGAIPTGTPSGRSTEQSVSASPATNTAGSSGTRNSRRAAGGSGPGGSGMAGSGMVGSGPAGALQDAGSAPGSSGRQRRLMSLPALGASSPDIPGELVREGAGICLEEMGLESADEVSDIHGSLSLQEQPEELGRDESSRKQSGGQDGRQQVHSSSSSSPCGALGWISHSFSSVPPCFRPAAGSSFSFVAELFGNIHWDFELESCTAARGVPQTLPPWGPVWPVRNRQGQISPGAFLTLKARKW